MKTNRAITCVSYACLRGLVVAPCRSLAVTALDKWIYLRVVHVYWWFNARCISSRINVLALRSPRLQTAFVYSNRSAAQRALTRPTVSRLWPAHVSRDLNNGEHINLCFKQHQHEPGQLTYLLICLFNAIVNRFAPSDALTTCSNNNDPLLQQLSDAARHKRPDLKAYMNRCSAPLAVRYRNNLYSLFYSYGWSRSASPPTLIKILFLEHILADLPPASREKNVLLGHTKSVIMSLHQATLCSLRVIPSDLWYQRRQIDPEDKEPWFSVDS